MASNDTEGRQKFTVISPPGSVHSENESFMTPSESADDHGGLPPYNPRQSSSSFDSIEQDFYGADAKALLNALRSDSDSEIPCQPSYTDPISGLAAVTENIVHEILCGVTELPRYAAGLDDSYHDRRNETNNTATGAGLAFGRGLVRIVKAGLTAPTDYTTAIAVGFNNIPKQYGDETSRESPKVWSLESGFTSAGQALALGIYDGVTGVFVQPVTGAQTEGFIGFTKGLGKGLGGLVCKPIAGACGVPSCILQGVQIEIVKTADKFYQKSRRRPRMRMNTWLPGRAWYTGRRQVDRNDDGTFTS